MTVELVISETEDQFPNGMRVLAVDEDRTCLLVLQKMLHRCQYNVTTTSEAITALKLLRESKNKFDLVISEVRLPDMDGFELLKLVRLEMDLPVIMLSANSDIKNVMKGITHGACDFLLKPLRLEVVKCIWQHVIRRKKFDRKDRYNSGSQDKPHIDNGEAAGIENVDQNGKLNKKTKDQNEDEDEKHDENGEDNQDPSTQKKPRVGWSGELNRKFVAAVNQLGTDKAVPKKILELRNVEKLTRENVASHLQGEEIPNFHPTVAVNASSPVTISAFNAPNPKSSYNGVLETQGSDHEQENGNQTSYQSIANDENEIVNVDANNLPIRRTKRRKLKSNVWEEFTKKKDENGKESAICIHCERKFDGSSTKGTTHLRNHLKRCKSKIIKARDQQLVFSAGRGDSKNESVDDEGNSSFDQDKSNMDVARMIIKHQCPLNMVEDEFFNALLKNLQPLFKLQSKEALSFDIFCVYNEEKSRLLKYFDELSCRFNLIVNLWALDLEENSTCCCYSVQFIDENWILREKILAIKSYRHECDTGIFYENFKNLLMDWNFHKKVCSLTIHSSYAGFKIVDELRKSWLSFEASHSLRTFYISCHDCIHGLLGKEISGENIGKSIDGASKTSSACFMDIHDIYYKKLSQQEKGYSLMNVTSDDNNWRTCSSVLAIATVLDPRFKFHLVEFSYSQIYDYGSAKIHLTIIHSVFTDIFNEYASHMYNGTSLFDDTNSFTPSNVEENILESFHRWYNSKSNVRTEASWKSELDKYLGEPIISSKMEIDVLGWWSEHTSSFPVLAKMACDILAIPMSSVIWGSSFSAKVLMNNSTFSGLDPQMIEAMICSKDWLESPKESCNIVRLKDSPSLAHYLEFKRFFSESDNEVSWHGDLERETRTWSEKDVRAYLVSPFTDEDVKHLRTWKSHAKSGELIGQDKIPAKALRSLLMIPPRDIDLEDARKYYIEDTVVDQFFILLQRRYERFPHKYIKHYSFNSFTATFLINKSKTEAEVFSWVKQEDLKGVRKLFLPMCLHAHWLLFVADIEAKKLMRLDSMGNSKMSNDSEKQVIQRWFLDFLLPKLGHNHRKDWSFDVPNDIPLQKNFVDCALFLMKYADCLTHGNYFPFIQDDMPHFRYCTFLDLCRGSLRL